jgi:hypothetical protein
MEMASVGVLTTAVLGYVYLGLPLIFAGFPYDRHIGRRIPPPQFLRHLEYRLWILLLMLVQFAVLLLVLLCAVSAIYLFYMRRVALTQLLADISLGGATAYFAGGMVLIVLPMLLFGLHFDRRIRSDAPEPPASAAEVKALRRYLTLVLSVLAFLVAAVSILMGAE